MKQYGMGGQSLDITFLGVEAIRLDDFRVKLAELGLELKKASSAIDWVEWSWSPGGRIILAANTHHGDAGYWVIIGFDSNEFRKLTSYERRKSLVDDFLDLGSRLWQAYPFYDGILAPEEEGPMFSSVKEEIRRYKSARLTMRGSNYATFLSREANRLALVEEWVPGKYPQASIRALPRDGVMVIWDNSMKGLEQYLSEEFRIS